MNFPDTLNNVFDEIMSLKKAHENEIKSLNNSLLLAKEAHEDLIKNYAIVNREFIDLVDVQYPCVNCGVPIYVEDIETFNPDFHSCGDSCG